MQEEDQEVKWATERRAVYEDLLRTGREAINRDAIRHARQYFLSTGSKFTPKPYDLPSERDAVGLVCAALPRPFAEFCCQLGDELISLLPREAGTDHIAGYVNDVNTMHMTLFHTSHPDELMPDARLRQPEDIRVLNELASKFNPLALKAHSVVLCSSGAIVLLYSVDQDSNSDPFTVDRLRLLAKQRFSPFPTRQSKAIMHTTLARLLDPDLPQAVIDSVHRRCAEITKRLREDNSSWVISELWFVDETHHYWASGKTTVIPLGSS